MTHQRSRQERGSPLQIEVIDDAGKVVDEVYVPEISGNSSASLERLAPRPSRPHRVDE